MNNTTLAKAERFHGHFDAELSYWLEQMVAAKKSRMIKLAIER